MNILFEYQKCILLSPDLLNQNQEQTIKHAFLAYKTAVISTDLPFYGEKR